METAPLWGVVLKAALLVVVPILVFLAGAEVMNRVSGRADLPEPDPPLGKPLNMRFEGYDAADATAYWKGLGPKGTEAELSFLELDLLFPFLYGAAFLGALLIAWDALGRRFEPAYLVAPMAVMLVADWVENLVHIRELRMYVASGAAPDATLIAVASIATMVKLFVGVGIFVLLVALAVWSIKVRLS
jgi:hypothetical protein